MDIQLRHARISDLPAIQELFVDTINAVCRNDYTPDQLKAWSDSIQDKERWLTKFQTQFFLVAMSGDRVVGFGSLEGRDYLDFLYVHKDCQRKGIASALYSEILAEALRRSAVILRADVSKTARPLFEKFGFFVTAEQTLMVREVAISNFKMEKRIGLH